MSKQSSTIDIVNRRLGRRYRAEKRFERLGLAAIIISLAFLAVLFTDIFFKGASAFRQTYILLDVKFDRSVLDVDNLIRADYNALVKQSLRNLFPEVSGRNEKKKLYALVSTGAAFQIQKMVMKDTSLIGTEQSIWVPADDDMDMLMKGKVNRKLSQVERRVKDNQLAWVDQLIADGRIEKR